MPAPNIEEQVKRAVAGLNTLYTRTLPVKVGTKAVSLTKKRFLVVIMLFSRMLEDSLSM